MMLLPSVQFTILFPAVLCLAQFVICFDSEAEPSSSLHSAKPSRNEHGDIGSEPVFSKPDPNLKAHPPGHMKALGSHRPPVKNGVDILDSVPSPVEFFDKYVKDGKPVLFRGAAKNMKAFKLWNDEYLRSSYGGIEVEVEEGKKENRSQGVWSMRLAEFIDQYQNKDMYMVHSVPSEMADDVGLLRCLLCDGFTKFLQDAVIWYSSGGTKSVLHFDSVDNINCVIDGEKELFMVDKRDKAHINIDSPNGAFSNVDVDKVDLNMYPGLGKVPWYNVTMHPSDCLFIPYKWFHHVHSQGRNLAVNIWFVHNMYFDRTSCEKKKDLPEFVPLSQFKMASSSEQIRAEIINIIDELGRNSLKESDILQMSRHLEIPPEAARSVFAVLDVDKDKQISLQEIYTCNIDDIAVYFPDENEEEAEEEMNRDEL